MLQKHNLSGWLTYCTHLANISSSDVLLFTWFQLFNSRITLTIFPFFVNVLSAKQTQELGYKQNHFTSQVVP